MLPSNKVFLIMGSVRAGRLCPQITDWIETIGRQITPNLTLEIIDLADWHLPMNDETGIPALGQYTQHHTIAWSNKIKDAEAIIFITPQFNWGYPAALKNAIDHLYNEWRNKPAIIITYGGHGGTRCARQLRRIAASLRMRVIPVTPTLMLSDAIIRHGAPLIPEKDFQASIPQIQKAFKQLSAILDNQETLLAKLQRNWKNTISSLS